MRKHIKVVLYDCSSSWSTSLNRSGKYKNDFTFSESWSCFRHISWFSSFLHNWCCSSWTTMSQMCWVK